MDMDPKNKHLFYRFSHHSISFLNMVEFEPGVIEGISGPVIIAGGIRGCTMHEVVRCGHEKLVGEIIKLSADKATIQCYEETAGISVGDPVFRTGESLSVELGPGLVSTVFDGIQRPLTRIEAIAKSVFIPNGIDVPPLDHHKLWLFHPGEYKVGDVVSGGDYLGWVQETPIVKHNIPMHPDYRGVLKFVAPEGEYTIDEVIAVTEYNGVETKHTMCQKWPVRRARPKIEKLVAKEPLVSGQRVLDALFPLKLGATCAIPGAFGNGKSVLLHSLAKHSNSDIIVYVAAGERGNEVAEMLRDFPKLKVGNSDIPIMDRTVIMANTSNMPVASREASIYSGITISEYFRDIGFNVSIMVDSSSRWAEALREISGRLGEMPADGGFPAYLGTRLSGFYERGGRVECIGSPKREGSVTIIAAVSPPGGDFSDPVCVATMNIVQAFWALDKSLAQRKHFPAIGWGQSYSKYDYIKDLEEHVDVVKEYLAKEALLLEVVKVAGKDSMPQSDLLDLEVARMIREDFLQQNGFTPFDYSSPIWKTGGIIKNLLLWASEATKLVTNGVTVRIIVEETEELLERIARQKQIMPDDMETGLEVLEQLSKDLKESFINLSMYEN
ncbi:hypothetical protein PCE1_002098 [Barthelona sp. PCE]